jgi:hypothetical protein
MSATHAVATRNARNEAAASRNHKNSQRVAGIVPGTQTGFPEKQFLVQRKENACACGGGCPRCALQAKRAISENTNPLERKADAVADRVMQPKGTDFGAQTPEPPVQRQAEPEEEEKEEEEPLQGKFESVQGKFSPSEAPAQLQGNRGHADNRASMPGPLKAGLESLSGMDLSGVRVHCNSSKPAQVDALAYTQGQDIHVSPGQEKHLAHEGWHAVQQMQGRVMPTMQAKGVSINDDAGLEREADVMGARALQMKPAEHATYVHAERGQLPRIVQCQKLPRKAEKKKQTRPKEKKTVKHRDVALFTDPLTRSAALVLTKGGKPEKVTSVDDLVAFLQSIDFPIRTLFVVAHSKPNAEIYFPSGGWIEPEKLAVMIKGALKAEFAPRTLDFRGCSIGTSPSGMEKLRSAIGASSVIGSTCYVVILHSKPIKVGGKKITEKAHIKRKSVARVFRKLLAKQLGEFHDSKDCIVDRSEKGYFLGGGRLVSIFVNKSFGKQYDSEASICFKDLPLTDLGDVVDAPGCKLLRVQAPMKSEPKKEKTIE